MTASLAAVILSYIRHELVTSHALLFGATLAGVQSKDISYLWSIKFWGAAQARLRRRRDKVALILLNITCAGLAISAGPASATLMRPRLDNWPAGGTDFWIDLSQDDLYSTNTTSDQALASCMSDTVNPCCPSYGWQTMV